MQIESSVLQLEVLDLLQVFIKKNRVMHSDCKVVTLAGDFRRRISDTLFDTTNPRGSDSPGQAGHLLRYGWLIDFYAYNNLNYPQQGLRPSNVDEARQTLCSLGLPVEFI